MAVTISQLLNLPVLEQAKVLTGTYGLENKVLSATLFDAPDGYIWVRKENFLFSTGYTFVSNYYN